MDPKEYRVICVGIGAQGQVGVKTLLDHKVKIVAAVDINDAIVGKDVAEVVGYPACGVLIEKDLETAIRNSMPNIAWVACEAGMDNLRNVLSLCANNKLNVTMVNMEPSYRMPVYADKWDEIDAVFKANGVSCFSSGTQDIWWTGIGMDMAGACKRVDAITTTATLPLQGQGISNCAEFRIGEDPEVFMAEVGGVNFADTPDTTMIAPIMSLMVNAEILGLHVTDYSVKMEALPAKEDFLMAEWNNMVIKKGTIIGQRHTFEVNTEEGIPLKYYMIIKCLEEGDKAGTNWDITGEPDLHVELGDICGEITTAAPAINRIPEIVAARPGLLTQADIRTRPSYRHGEWVSVWPQ